MPHISFAEFEPGNMEKWAICAEKELFAPISSLPKWDFGAGATVPPYLTKNELNTTKTGLIQGVQKRSNGWKNLPIVKRKDFGSIKKLLTKIPARGAYGAIVDLSEIVHSQYQLISLVKEIPTENFMLFLELPDSKYDIPFDKLANSFSGGLAYDPVAKMMKTGKIDTDYIYKISEYSKTQNTSQQFYPLQVQSHVFHESGANPVQELAFTIGTFVYYLDLLTEQGVAPRAALSSFSFSLSTGTNYFSEIAKGRAFRVLIAQVAENYGVKRDIYQPFIQCLTSNLYLDYQESHTNLVRKTISAMSGVLGGCDALTISNEDIAGKDETEIFEDLGQTISLLLSHEGKFDDIADATAGSYLIESMTEKMATAAWDLFLAIEEQGGILGCFKSGQIQRDINSSYERLLKDRRQTSKRIDESQFIDNISKSNPESPNLEKRNLAEDLRKLASLNSVKA